MSSCVFCKIRDGKIAKEFTYQDDEIMVFPDIHPIRPIHLLIVPKEHVEDLLNVEDESLMKKIMEVVKKTAIKTNLDKKGYRVLINGGGAQIIKHLHVHLYGPMSASDNL